MSARARQNNFARSTMSNLQAAAVASHGHGTRSFRRAGALLAVFLLGAASAHAQTVTPPAATSPTPAPKAQLDGGVPEMATGSRMKEASQQQQTGVMYFAVGNILVVGL